MYQYIYKSIYIYLSIYLYVYIYTYRYIVEWDQDWEASLCCVLARHTGSPDCGANICLRFIHVRGIHVPPHGAMPDDFFGSCSWPQPCRNEFTHPNEHAWRVSRNHKHMDRFHRMSSRLEPSKRTSLRTSENSHTDMVSRSAGTRGSVSERYNPTPPPHSNQ